MEIDFDDVAEAERVEPEKWYRASIKDIQELVGRESGNPYWSVTWELMDYPTLVYNAVFLSKKSYPRLKSLRKALGLRIKGKVKIDPSEFIGRGCQIYVIEKEWEGKKNLDIPWAGFKELSPGPKIVDMDEVDNDNGDEEVIF